MGFYRLSITRLGALVASLALAVAGCSSGDSEDAKGGAGGSGGTGGKLATPSALAFDPSSTLTLVPAESHELAIVATPPAVYRVRFSLLGDYKDASLDKNEVDTDLEGRATLLVNAATAATTFRIRASAGDSISAEAGVSVSASGFGTLQVTPKYAGKRTVSHWVASVRTGSSCAELAGKLTTDGDLKGTAPAGQVPQIDGVPVGPALAVTLRGALSVAGCKDVSELRAGETTGVTIEVSDLPMKTNETDLVVALGIDGSKGDIAPVLDALAPLSALLNGATDDVDALLDAMQLETPDATALSAFQTARQAAGWDAAVTATLGGPAVAPKAIRTLVEPWLKSGLASVPGVSSFEGRLQSSSANPGIAHYLIESVGGVPASEAGFPAGPIQSTWEGQPDDTVALATSLFFVPSLMTTALAVPFAQKAAPGAQTVPQAVAALLTCADVAQTLVDKSGGGEAYSGCAKECAALLCASALDALWQKARDASGSTAATVTVSASGDATVDDGARPISFTGTWVGTLSVGSLTTNVYGQASGTKPPPPR